MWHFIQVIRDIDAPTVTDTGRGTTGAPTPPPPNVINYAMFWSHFVSECWKIKLRLHERSFKNEELPAPLSGPWTPAVRYFVPLYPPPPPNKNNGSTPVWINEIPRTHVFMYSLYSNINLSYISWGFGYLYTVTDGFQSTWYDLLLIKSVLVK